MGVCVEGVGGFEGLGMGMVLSADRYAGVFRYPFEKGSTYTFWVSFVDKDEDGVGFAGEIVTVSDEYVILPMWVSDDAINALQKSLLSESDREMWVGLAKDAEAEQKKMVREQFGWSDVKRIYP